MWVVAYKSTAEEVDERLVKGVYRENMEGNRGRGRLHRRWRDEVKELLMGRGMSERESEIHKYT